MRQYNRLHIAVVAQHGKTPNPLEFFALLKAAYPTIRSPEPYVPGAPLPESRITPLFLHDEPLAVVYDAVYTQPLCLHYDVFWAVASLHVIREFIENVTRCTVKCDLLCVRYPDELNRPFTDAISPLFDYQEISMAHIVSSSFLCLLDASMSRVTKIGNRYLGYAGMGLKEFLQVDLSDQVVRVRYGGEEEEADIVRVVRDAMEVCECVESMIEQLP